MRRESLVVAMFFLLCSPVFAATLNITATNLAPAFVNTRSSIDVLNFSLNVSGGTNAVNLTSINVTIINAFIANVSAVQIKNATGSVVASSTTNSSIDNFTVTFSNGFFVNGTTNGSLIVNINVSGNAAKHTLVAINISNSSILAAGDSTVFSSGAPSNQSSLMQVQDVHSNVSVSPNFVDTNVTNQTFTYTMLITTDRANKTTIFMPNGYNITNILNVSVDGTECLPGNVCPTAFNASQININFTHNSNAGVTGTVRVNFTANTNASEINGTAFLSKVSGSNLTDVDSEGTTVMNVTTRRMLNVTNVEIIKGTAIVNGTDYWEFNFTVQANANVSGLLQFKMSNFTEFSGGIITPTEGNFTLRKGAALTSSSINVSHSYSLVDGIPISAGEAAGGFLVKLTLRILIPIGEVSSPSWQATYGMLFRSIP